jgi:hypothetical protein
MESESLFIRSAQLHQRASELTTRSTVVTGQIRAEIDLAVLTRTRTRRLLEQGMRLEDLRRQSEAAIYRRIVYFGELVDAEVCEDNGLLAELTAMGCECDKCGEADPITAVIQFGSIERTLAVCAGCFQQLIKLSLGQVI